MPEGWPLPWALAEKPEAYLACTCNPLRSVGSPPHARTPTSQHWSRGKEPAQHLASKIKGLCLLGRGERLLESQAPSLKDPLAVLTLGHSPGLWWREGDAGLQNHQEEIWVAWF